VPISVIMPCHNADRFVRTAVESILRQKFADWELIVVDDGSTDRTADIVGSFRDERIRMFRLAENRGNYCARNFGLRQARGKYVAMFDADDISKPNRLQVQQGYLERNKHVGCIGSNYGLIDRAGYTIGKIERHCSYPEFKLRMLLDNYMLQSTVFVRRHLLEKYGIAYDDRYRYASDYHFVFQCCTHFNTHNISDVLVDYRINPDGITQTKFMEQQRCASAIRAEVFRHYFSEVLTPDGLALVDKIFNQHNSGDKVDMGDVETLFNLFLVHNHEKKHFHRKKIVRSAARCICSVHGEEERNAKLKKAEQENLLFTPRKRDENLRDTDQATNFGHINTAHMGIATYLNRVSRIHSLVMRKSTGSPEEFARKMNLSRSALLKDLSELKALGFPIEYDKHRNSYRYNLDKMENGASFDVPPEVLKKIFGGKKECGASGALDRIGYGR